MPGFLERFKQMAAQAAERRKAQRRLAKIVKRARQIAETEAKSKRLC